MTRREKLEAIDRLDRKHPITDLMVHSLLTQVVYSATDEAYIDETYDLLIGSDDGSEPGRSYVDQDGGEEDQNRSLYHNDNEDSEGYREDGCPWIYTE